MAFNTYQCNQYLDYLEKHKRTINDIYKLIVDSPFTFTELGRAIGVNYYGIKYRLNNQTLTYEETVKLLNFIK